MISRYGQPVKSSTIVPTSGEVDADNNVPQKTVVGNFLFILYRYQRSIQYWFLKTSQSSRR